MDANQAGLFGPRAGAWISLHEQVEPYPKNQRTCYVRGGRGPYSDYGASANWFRKGDFNLASMRVRFTYPDNHARASACSPRCSRARTSAKASP